MRLVFILVCCSVIQTQAPTSGPSAPGLRITNLKVKEARSTPSPLETIGRQDRTESSEDVTLKEVGDDKRERDLRALSRQPTSTTRRRTSPEGYGYEISARITNESVKPISELVWAYRPSRNSQIIVEKEFYCQLKIDPGKSHDLKVSFTARVVNASSPVLKDALLSDVVIEQVSYGDGSTWARQGWNPATYSAGATQKPKVGKCVGL